MKKATVIEKTRIRVNSKGVISASPRDIIRSKNAREIIESYKSKPQVQPAIAPELPKAESKQEAVSKEVPITQAANSTR